MGSSVSYELTDEQVVEKGGDLITKGFLGRSTTYKLGAGRISWGEGFLDPSDMERGPGDSEENNYDIKMIEAKDTEGEKYVTS